MANIIIPFDNKNYPVDESSLSAAQAALRSHLSTVMNGTGATIKLGGVSYNIDATKLQNARTAFVSHLGTVAGSGYKVVVNGVEYNVDATKMTGAVADLNTVLGGLQSGGNGGSDLVMNEYGFYFDVPYVRYGDSTKAMFTFFADGSFSQKSMDTDTGEVFEETSLVGGLEYNLNQVIHKESNTVIIEFTDNGTKFELDGIVFTLETTPHPVMVA